MEYELDDEAECIEMNNEILLNNVATRCFRNVADQDYITARLCYRYKLPSQAYWASLQAIEKYSKAILLYSRLNSTKIGHDLEKAIRAIKASPYQVKISDSTEEFIIHLNRSTDRYLSKYYDVSFVDIFRLDRAVWEIRRYCNAFREGDNESNNASQLKKNLDSVHNLGNDPLAAFSIINGTLEKIISNRHHEARPALVWNNIYFEGIDEAEIYRLNWSVKEWSPYDLDDETEKLVKKLIFVPPKK